MKFKISVLHIRAVFVQVSYHSHNKKPLASSAP